MGMFSGVDNDEPSSRSLFAKLKGLRASFTESTPAAMPIAGAEPHFESEKPAAARRNVAAEPVTGQAMTLGMRLRMGDVTDVDVHDLLEHGGAIRKPAVDVRASDAPVAPPALDAFSAEDLQPDGNGSFPQAMSTAPAMSASPLEPAGNAVQPDAVARATEVHSTEPADRGTDLVAPEVTITPTGLPQLISADAITFKRILCERSADAALKITDAARREFVAVDLQAGVAIVVTTKRFHETALYSTYLKDLVRADIAVREEMIATEEVISALYAKEKNRSAAIVPESSRAIGTFRDVMEAAHAYGSSDVHWEYRDFNDEVELRFRVNGDLYSYRSMPKALVRRALSAAYQDLVQRNTNSGETFQPSAPQSAMIPLVAQMDLLNLRWQSSPLVGGFDVALRLLDGNFRNFKVRLPGEMGLEPSQLRIIESLGNVSGGVVILTGETGSAKTTLLRALSYQMSSRDLSKQYAVSEPAEYPQPWLSEISIPRRPDETDDDANRKAAEVIRTLMRMDPDDLTINEVRDRVMAALVAELALTGHPVRTSFHADSAIGAFMRLVGGRLQLPIDEVSSEKFVNAVGNQKLIPLLCPHCKRPANDVMPAAQLELLRTKFGLDTSKMACRDEDGCEHCRLPGLFTRAGKVAAGTKGQTLVMELFRPTPEFLDHIAMRDWRGAEKVWRSTRATGFGDADMTGKTIYEHALYKASIGVIDARFIDESMKPFSEYHVFADRDGRMPS
ncbi:ATPase, T2SS/T4P/T4SS family [Paraburkholderia sp. SARCC-3016]|nr:ATPase, T2SS/T4P/T4SS family [Paraburkholderia sp. SARCC-3016]MDQ7980370.1 ATPase, T2SS/T4P/T4SS family [Paraburkholderia sp. SARCC-3016]